jgi:hypothetical protein
MDTTMTMKWKQSRSPTSSTDSCPPKTGPVAATDQLGLSYDEMDMKVLSYEFFTAVTPSTIAIHATYILNCIVSEACGLLDPFGQQKRLNFSSATPSCWKWW